MDGWAHRYSVGLQYQDDTYSTDPSLVAPSQVPADLKLVAPFLRYEIVEDDFEKVKNRNQIERAEYFALGFNSQLQLGRAMTALGSTRDLWLYTAPSATASRSRAITSCYPRTRTAATAATEARASSTGRWANTITSRTGATCSSRRFPRKRWQTATTRSQLQLGGDNGLRGYPLRYQTGTHRALLSLEERGYTDWYPFRLFRVGGAVFYDHGRAWGGVNQNTVNPGWLSDVGFGLRILNDRQRTRHRLHIDIAFPLNADPSIKSYQILLKTRTHF